MAKDSRPRLTGQALEVALADLDDMVARKRQPAAAKPPPTPEEAARIAKAQAALRQPLSPEFIAAARRGRGKSYVRGRIANAVGGGIGT